MVDCTAVFNFRAERINLIFKKKISLQKNKNNKKEFQMEIKNRFHALRNNKDNIEVMNCNLIDIFRESAEKVGSAKNNRESKYCKITNDLMKRRRTIQVKTKRDVIKRAELGRDTKNKRNMDRIEETIRNGKSMKKARRRLALGRQK